MVRCGLEQRAATAEEAVRHVVAALDPDSLTPAEAGGLLESLDKVARIAEAGSTLLARRISDGDEWRQAGFSSAAEYLATRTGTGLGAARRRMRTSKALRTLPNTRRLMAAGRLSPDQADTIADAAQVNPEAEDHLVDTAARGNLNELRDEALRAKAAADPDAAARHERLRRERRLRRYTDAEGCRHLNIRGPVDEVAVIEAEVDRRLSARIRSHAAGEALDEREAMSFDAAVDMAQRSQRADAPADGTGTAKGKGRQPAPQHLALLRLDVSALWRGHVVGDELCEITGLGPIPVEAARRLLGDAVIKLIITKGDAVAHVTSLTRGPTQAMRYALLWTSPTCTAEGCTRTVLEHDHRYGAEYKDTKHTRLDQLDRLCHTHHDLHTHHKWALVVGTGKRPMVPPDDPRHPCHTPASEARAGPQAGPRAGPRAAPTPPRSTPDPTDSASVSDTDPATRARLRAAIDHALAQRARAVDDRAEAKCSA